MTELQSRARDEIEKAFGEEICEHFHNLILRLSGDRFDLLNLSKYGDQFENGLIAIKAAREMALDRVDMIFSELTSSPP